MDAKLPIDIFEKVLQLATEGSRAVAQYIREVLSSCSCNVMRCACVVTPIWVCSDDKQLPSAQVLSSHTQELVYARGPLR